MPQDPHQHQDLAARLDAIEARLARLEGAVEREAPADEIAAEPATPPPPPTSPTFPIPPAQLPAPPPAPTPPVDDRPTSPVEVPSPASPPPTAVRVPGRRTSPFAAELLPPRPPRPVQSQAEIDAARNRLEVFFGGKGLAWIGAIFIVIGGGLFAHLAYKQGWWQAIPAVWRCVGIAAFGGLLIAAGEIILRRISAAAAVGLFGAGLGLLYLDAFSAFRVFGLVTQGWAFALMGLVAIIGFAITWRTRFTTIGVLSLIGGYGAPLMLRGMGAYPTEMAAYLTMLLGIALTLSAFQPRPFRVLRSLALSAQMGLALWWLLAVMPGGSWFVGLTFTTLWWAMFIGESLFAAVRRQTWRLNVFTTVIATAAFITAGVWVLHQGQPAGVNWLGLYTGGIGIICAALALMFGDGAEGLRRRPGAAIDVLCATLWVQAAILIVTAIALHFDGYGRSIGWLAIAVGAIEVGRRIDARSLSIFGLIVGGLAVIMVNSIDLFFGTLGGVLVEVGQRGTIVGHLRATEWTILASATIAAVVAAALRLRAGHLPRSAHAALLLVAAGLWLFMWLMISSGLLLTLGWLAAAAMLFASTRFIARHRTLEIGLVVLAITALRWITINALAVRVNPSYDAAAALPWLNPQAATGLAILAVGAYAILILRRRMQATQSDASVGQWVGQGIVFAAIFALIAMTFETERAVDRLATGVVQWSQHHMTQLMLTILWSVGVVVTAGIARLVLDGRASAWKQVASVRRFAWAVLGVVTVKWLAIDTLICAVAQRGETLTLLPGINLQVLTAAILIGSIAVLWRIARPFAADSRAETLALPAIDIMRRGLIAIGAMLLLWAMSFEVDRLVVRLESFHWPTPQVSSVWITLLWCFGGVGMLAIALWQHHRRWLRTTAEAGTYLSILAAVAWLLINCFHYRVTDGVVEVMPLLNLLGLSGLAILGALAATVVLRHRYVEVIPRDVALVRFHWRMNICHQVLIALLALLVIIIGSIEIERLLTGYPVRVQAGLSIWWGLCGVGLVIIGFVRRWSLARRAGLVLLGITLLKVLIVDLSEAAALWRVVSFVATGLLLVGTSVLYVKYAPRVLEALADEDDPSSSPA